MRLLQNHKLNIHEHVRFPKSTNLTPMKIKNPSYNKGFLALTHKHSIQGASTTKYYSRSSVFPTPD